MAGWPFCAGKVISKTPNSFFFISCESRFQLSGSLSVRGLMLIVLLRLTEVSNEVGSQSTLSPFAVDNVAIGLDVEAQNLVTLVIDRQYQRSGGMRKLESYATELFKTSFLLVDRLHPVLGLAVSALQGILEGRQPRVELDDACTASASVVPFTKESQRHTSAVIGDIVGGWVARDRVVGRLVDRIHNLFLTV